MSRSPVSTDNPIDNVWPEPSRANTVPVWGEPGEFVQASPSDIAKIRHRHVYRRYGDKTLMAQNRVGRPNPKPLNTIIGPYRVFTLTRSPVC